MMKMRSIATLCVLLCSGAVHAATWIGGASGSFQDATNWDTGVVPGQNNPVNISGKVTVTDSGRRDWWGQTVIVENGATLDCTASASKWQQGTVTVQNGGRIVIRDNGTDIKINNSGGLVINCFTQDGLHIEDHVEITNAGASTALNFGLQGSMYVNEIWNRNWDVTMNFTLDIGAPPSPSAIYSIETRTLVDLDHNTGGGVTNMLVTSSSVQDLLGGALTSVSSDADLTADASGLGKYYLHRDDAQGGDWVVKYVKASGAAVPEPSTALLGVFGLAGLLLRRKR